MKFCRIIERGNRQILITVGQDEESNEYTLTIETHYVDEEIVFITITGFTSFADASQAMQTIVEDEVIQGMSEFIDSLPDR
jgi:hypothetical protein